MRYSDFKLKVSIARDRIASFVSEMFPANAFPRDSNGPLGDIKRSRWSERLDKRARFQAFLLSILLTPAGIYGVTLDHTSLFGWMFVVFGTYSTFFLFIMQYYDKKKLEEDIAELRQRIENLERK